MREGEAAATRKQGPKRPEKLDAHKDYIAGRMRATAPDVIPAAVLLHEIQARGYDGGYTRVKVFVRSLDSPAASLYSPSDPPPPHRGEGIGHL